MVTINIITIDIIPINIIGCPKALLKRAWQASLRFVKALLKFFVLDRSAE